MTQREIVRSRLGETFLRVSLSVTSQDQGISQPRSRDFALGHDPARSVFIYKDPPGARVAVGVKSGDPVEKVILKVMVLKVILDGLEGDPVEKVI